MKQILTILLISVCISATSQTLEGFMGIKFGASSETVKHTMSARPECRLNKQYSTEESLAFEGAMFAGRQTAIILFSFVNNKFYTASVFIIPSLESEAIELFNTIKEELDEKYFSTREYFETYKYPYEKGDGYTESAIKQGKASFIAFWAFQDADSSNKNFISLEIGKSLSIIITYQDGNLIKEASMLAKEKNYKDY